MQKNNEYEEPPVTKEQESLFLLIQDISQKIKKQLDIVRAKAIQDLLDSNMSSIQKRTSLKQYFDYRMNSSLIVANSNEGHQYCICDIPRMAKQLYDDNTFYYNDSDRVLDWLSFLEDSFTYDDEILAFHYYRLENSTYNLGLLVYILCIFIPQKLRFSIEAFNSNADYVLSREESIYFINQLLTNVMCILEKCKKLSFYKKGTYILEPKEIMESFSDRIEFDAGREVAISMAFNQDSFYEKYHGQPEPKKTLEEKDKDKNEIDAWYYFELLSRSIRSTYLLSAIIDMVGTNNFTIDILQYRAKCRKMCDQLFDDEVAFELLSEDRKLKADKLIIEERNRDSELLEESLFSYLDIIRDEIQASDDISEILRRRTEWLRNAKATLSSETVGKLEKKISQPVSDRLVALSSKKPSLHFYSEKVKRLLGDKYINLGSDILNTLATAEMLFDEYAICNPQDGFDYSGISALYYQALENTYNSLFWSQYAEYLNCLEIEGVKLSAFISTKDRKSYGYFPLYKGNVQNANFVDAKQGYIVKDSCTFGAFEHVLRALWQQDVNCIKLLEYFAKRLGYENVDVLKQDKKLLCELEHFGLKFSEATNNRNNAAHGTEIINKEQCLKDKIDIISEERQNSIGLIRQFLLLFLNNDR